MAGWKRGQTVTVTWGRRLRKGDAWFSPQERDSMFGSPAQSPWRSSICITPTRSSFLIASLRRAVCPLLSTTRGLELNLQVSWSCQVERNSSHQLQHWVRVGNYSCGHREQIPTAFSLETDAGWCLHSLRWSHWMWLLSRDCAVRRVGIYMHQKSPNFRPFLVLPRWFYPPI